MAASSLSINPYSGAGLPTGVYRNPNSKAKPYRAKYGDKHLGYFATVSAAYLAYKNYRSQKNDSSN